MPFKIHVPASASNLMGSMDMKSRTFQRLSFRELVTRYTLHYHLSPHHFILSSWGWITISTTSHEVPDSWCLGLGSNSATLLYHMPWLQWRCIPQYLLSLPSFFFFFEPFSFFLSTLAKMSALFPGSCIPFVNFKTSVNVFHKFLLLLLFPPFLNIIW